MVTIFKNIFNKEPHYIDVDKALARIKTGKSKEKVNAIRNALDKERANELKRDLPSVCFSGKFGENRTDAELLEHSGFIVLDFDDIEDTDTLKHDLIARKYIKAAWVSPSGNGVKALVKIQDPSKHKEHFQALQDEFLLIDKSGVNPSRVCYESWDEDIFIQDKITPFTKLKTIERVIEKTTESDNGKTFDKILKWLTNKGDAFVTGERNLFIFKLASACCRFGLGEDETERFINGSILINDNSFTNKEAIHTIKSAYKANASKYGSAYFEKDVLTEKTTKKEIEIDPAIYDMSVKPKDVIFGEDVKKEALDIYEYGYQSATTTNIPEIDEHFKWKRGEVTLLSGIGNYGKSTFLKYILLMKAIHDGWKFALFSPEDCPASEFYHDLVEMMAGLNFTPSNPHRPRKLVYETLYDFISQHFFFVYPKDVAPTPTYIKERFLELMIKEKIDVCVIDPFNQMTNDYASVGGRDDKYLEAILADFKRFTETNNTHFVIVAHPKGGLKKDGAGNYECPDVFDLAGGAMWNNKMDNIYFYHRPMRGQDPEDTSCQFVAKKVRRQKIVGKLGTLDFNLKRHSRRYLFGGKDYIDLHYKQEPPKQEEIFDDIPF